MLLQYVGGSSILSPVAVYWPFSRFVCTLRLSL